MTTDATHVPAGANVSEKQARQVAEAAREKEWRKPSFGKELFLGRFRLDLIDPPPQLDPERTAAAEDYLGRLREFAANKIDGAQIERDAFIPDDVLNGVKLWATNGTLATLLVVMAQVPPSEGHRGGITAFVVEGDSPGITVERRNAFLGLRGLENSVTRFHDVRVPKENVIGREGQGLKIALTTLNTGRLSLPAMCVSAAKWCLSIARQWGTERVQWGLPVARHEAVAKKIAFIAATTYGLESMLDLCCLLADDDRNDIRIEAALVKLFGSEMAWLVADELIQVRGGRGFGA